MSNITNLLDELKKLTELHDQLGAKITDHRNLIMDEPVSYTHLTLPTT